MAPQEELPTASTTSCTDSQSRVSLKTSLWSSALLISEKKILTFEVIMTKKCNRNIINFSTDSNQ